MERSTAPAQTIEYAACPRSWIGEASFPPDDTDLIENESRRRQLKRAMRGETRFGIGAAFTGRDRRDHEVMEDADWGLSGNVAWLKDKAWHQLGTSGSGNHFLDAGILTPVSDEAAAILGIEPGREHFAELASRCSRALRRCGRANPPRAPLPSGTR